VKLLDRVVVATSGTDCRWVVYQVAIPKPSDADCALAGKAAQA